MLLVHKIELAPNDTQRTFFARSCGVARFAYNWALAEWKRQYEAGGKPGYPRFKKRGIHDSFRADNGPPAKGRDAVTIDGKRIQIPRLGWVRMREPLRFQGQIKQVTISRRADRWYAAILVDAGPPPHASRKNHDGAVGVDLGVKALATLSTGEVVTGPKPHRAKRKLARLHKQIADIRGDAIHKLTTRLVLGFDRIGIEDLSVRGMAGNRRLARSILDQAFREVRRQLEYKAAWYGIR